MRVCDMAEQGTSPAAFRIVNTVLKDREPAMLMAQKLDFSIISFKKRLNS